CALPIFGSVSIADNFVDHYRGEGESIDYDWEERWIRDEGFLRAVPQAVEALLKKTGAAVADIAHFVMPSDQSRAPAAVAKKLGIQADALIDNYIDRCGVTGAAHPLLLLT